MQKFKRRRTSSHSITEVASEVGLDPLECPHCGKPVKTQGLINAMWKRLARRLAKKERFHIRGFGTFYCKEYPAKEIKSPMFPDIKMAPPYLQIRFKQSEYVKSIMNTRKKEAWKKYHSQ